MNQQRLIEAALAAMEQAYAPYSHYRVGAALCTGDGRLYKGCNIENASYGATICAERVALATAVADGCRDFRAMAVVADGASPPFPCGPCLQMLAEFCGDDFEIIIQNTSYKFSALYPHPFQKSDEKP